MSGSSQVKAKVVVMEPTSAYSETLPYCIELWSEDQSEVERVLARAVNASLARAIFTAAREEHPHRYITLRRGARVIAASDKYES